MSSYLRMATEELYAAHQEAGIGPLESRMLRVIDDLIHHLEAQNPPAETQQSEEPPAPMVRVTTAVRSDADSAQASVRTETVDTTPTTPLLQRLLGALLPEERSIVERDSAFKGQSVASSLSQLMRVPDADLQKWVAEETSTSQNPATSPSAATPSGAATLPSGSSEQTDRSTGPSVSIDDADVLERANRAMGWLQIASDASELMPILDELRKRDACGHAVAEALVALTAVNWSDIPNTPASASPAEDASREGREVQHTKRIHYVVENGAALLVCDNGSKCCSYPAGKYEMDQVLRHVNQAPATEARDER